MGLRLIWLAMVAFGLTIVINTVIIFNTPDPPIEHVVSILPPRKLPTERVIPPFPQLAPEHEDPPDAAVEDAAVQDGGWDAGFKQLVATLGGVAWSDNPLMSSVVLEFERYPDEVEFVYSLHECVDDRPCQIIRDEWKLVTIEPKHIVVMHIPSGVLQDLWLVKSKPEADAGVVVQPPADPLKIWKAPWHKRWDDWY